MSCTETLHHDMQTRFCPDCGNKLRPDVIRIHYRADLQEAAELLGVRPDWHEPDEQEVTALIGGHCFDNAGFWPENTCSQELQDIEATEIYVELRKEGRPVAIVNLATLFAMACGTVE